LPSGITLSGSTISGIPMVAATYTFVIEASNSQGNVSTGTLTIVTTAEPVPVNSVIPSITGSNEVGDILSLTSNGTWSNNPISYTYQWTSGGVSVPGATASTYMVQTTDQGNNITCTIIGNNYGGSSTPITTASVAIPAASNVAPSLVADTPPAGIVGVSYSYTFTASGTPAPTFSVSSGTLPSYLTFNPTTGVLSGVPNTVQTETFVVTATNSQGSVSTGTLSVAITAYPASNGVPVYGGNATISGTATYGNVMTVFAGSWQNSPNTYEYQWNRNGTAITSATGGNYTTVSADNGTTLTCTIVATNTTGNSAPQTTAGVAIT
jgi:Putative Ig domain